MAKGIAKNWFVSIDGNDISSNVESVSLPMRRGDGEVTAMGDTWELWVPGIKGFSCSVNLLQDYAAGALDSIIWPLFDAATEAAIIIRPDAGAVSTSNPQFAFTAFIGEWGIEGQLKSVHKASIPLKNTDALVRTTA